jgi:hypothetical protein
VRRHVPERLILAVLVAVLAGLAAGCGSAAKSVISTLPSKAASAASNLPTIPPASPTAPAQPTTAEPTTAEPTTVEPTTQAPTPQPNPTSAPAAQPTSSAAPTSSSSNLVWLWIAIAAVVLIGAIIWIARSAGRRKAAQAGWRTRVIDTYAKGSALYDAMSVAEDTGGPAAADASARWADIQRRADDFAQNLYALREAAPDEEARVRVTDTIAALQGVRSAMEAEHRPGGAGPQQAETVRARLSFFESALRALRAVTEPMP